MANLSIFTFQSEKSVRVETVNGEPLFCLTDVADILEISNANPSRFNLKDDGVHKMYSIDSKGRKQELTFINEPNLYRVIFRSNKPEAVKFQDWIFEEVIPQIRKTGSYELHLDRWLTEWERAQIRAAVKERCERTGESSQAVYRKLHAFMGIPSYEQIGAAQFQTALNFLASMENAPDLFRRPQGILITEEQIYQLSTLTRYASQMSELYRHLHPALRRLGSAYSGEAASWAEVPHYWVCKMQQFLMQAYKQMQDPKHIEGVKANFALMS